MCYTTNNLQTTTCITPTTFITQIELGNVTEAAELYPLRERLKAKGVRQKGKCSRIKA
jgi:hypothetical protein